MFDAKTYEKRRKKLLGHFSEGILLFVGMPSFADMRLPFFQDSSFLYYFGLDHPDFIGYIDCDRGVSGVYLAKQPADDVIWHGLPDKPLFTIIEQMNLHYAGDLQQASQDFRAHNAKGREIHFLPMIQPILIERVQSLLDIALPEARLGFSPVLRDAVIEQRSIKEQQECEEIIEAVSYTYKIHELAMQLVSPGASGLHIMAEFEKYLYENQLRWAYPSIFTTHGEILHNNHYENHITDGQLMLHDAGVCSRKYYTSDVTRTFPVSGRFSSRQRDIYDIVWRMQRSAKSLIKPGVLYKDIHLAACKEAVLGLIELGLMQGDPDQAVAEGAHALFFPHGLGHMMGLDTHDMEFLGEDAVGYNTQISRSDQFGLNMLRLAKPLQKDFVITCEPGIYFIPELIKRWQAEKRHSRFICYNHVGNYMDFGGVRLEDDLLVTANGYQNFSESIPLLLPDVECWCEKVVG